MHLLNKRSTGEWWNFNRKYYVILAVAFLKLQLSNFLCVFMRHDISKEFHVLYR